jgi:hypothetical protein
MTSSHYFPHLISSPFMTSLRVVFLFAAGMTLLSAILSVFRGERFIYDDSTVKVAPMAPGGTPTKIPVSSVLLSPSAVWMAKDGASTGTPKEREEQLRRSLTLLSVALGHSRTEESTMSLQEMQRKAEASYHPVVSEQRP